MARNTTTGKYYEDVVAPVIKRSCEKNNLSIKAQSNVGQKPQGGKHVVDVELISNNDPNKRGLISCKVQHVKGTTDEKIPYEVIKLIHMMKSDPRYKKAWIVLGGAGISPELKEFYKTELEEFIPDMKGKVVIITSTDELLSTDLSLD